MPVKTGKAILLIILALLLSLLIAEVVSRYVIGYPVYGVQSKIHYRQGGEYWTTFWQPHAKEWNVEAGNKVISFNNLGIPGIDVDLSKKHYIAVLGSSYVEAMQMQPPDAAASIFSRYIASHYSDYAVMNLGYYRHDPHDSWWRMEYFKQKFPIDYAVLVLNSDYRGWFPSHPHPLSFQKAPDFGRINNSRVVNYSIKLRNLSSFVNLIAISQQGKINIKPPAPAPAFNPSPTSGKKAEAKMMLNADLTQTLLEYQRTCPHFILVSIVDDADYNAQLTDFCARHHISFTARPLIKDQYRLKENGHLNVLGNKLLGVLLIQAFQKYQIEMHQ